MESKWPRHPALVIEWESNLRRNNLQLPYPRAHLHKHRSMCTHVNTNTNITYTCTLTNEPFIKFSRISTVMFFTSTLLEQSIIHMLRTFLLRWERENFTCQFIWQPMMSERTLSVFPEGHRARNLVCYCIVADDLAKFPK